MSVDDRKRTVLAAFRYVDGGEATVDELTLAPPVHRARYGRRAVQGMLGQLERDGLVEARLTFGRTLWRPTDAGAAALG